MSIKMALVGNPNCGKTTMFNAMTGANQYVGNWPGVTVEKKEGKLKGYSDVVVTDLPGIYSLSPYTLEEVVSRNYLINERPDAILNLVDATNLERNLYLTTQVLEMGIPVVVALNMMDLVRKNGDQINAVKLSEKLGCPVVEVSALKGTGLKELYAKAVEMAGALAVTALTVSDMTVMVGLGRETIAKMDDFSGLLLPAMAALTAATGGVSGAAVRQGATVLCSSLLIRGIDGLLVPLLYAYIAACCAHAALGSDGLKKLAALIKGTIVFLLTAGLLAFVGYLTASGAIAGSADAAAVKAAKMTISRAIPVVGGILSDAAETVLAGAGVLRGTVGVVGMLVVLAICLTPFLQLALHYLTYKGAAALTGTVAGPRLSGLMDSLGGAFGLILGMTGSCALVLLFSIVSAVSAVMG